MTRGSSLQRLLRAQAALFDGLLAAVGEEYSREECGRLHSTEQRRADRVRRLLAGELLDTSELAYELSGWHLGILAVGPGAAEALTELSQSLDRRLLLVSREDGAIWAWLGGRLGFDSDQVELFVAHAWPTGVSLALGEPGEGLPGWRLTHRQAKAALPIALRREESAVRYGDMALLASMLRDDLLVTSLRQLYLEPLSHGRDGGKAAHETLRAYFAADRNVSSAAAILGVSRQAVAKRLGTLEEQLGRSLGACGFELEASLRLDDYDPTPRARP